MIFRIRFIAAALMKAFKGAAFVKGDETTGIVEASSNQ